MTSESTPAQPEPKDGMPVALHLLTPQQLLPIWQERNGPGVPMGWANIYEFFVDCVQRFVPSSPEPQPKTEKAEARWSIEEAAHLLADRICQRHYVEWVLRKCVDSALAATAQAPDRDDLVLSLRPSEWKSLSLGARAHLRAIVRSGIALDAAITSQAGETKHG